MNDVGHKAYPGKIPVWLVVLLLLLATMAIGTSVTVAKTLCTHKNRAGENSVAAVRLCPAPNPQTPDLQLENSIGRYDLVLDDTLAASKDFPGIGRTADGVSDFAGTPYLYPVAEGQLNIVQITLTGSYSADIEAANAAGGFTTKPPGYMWHHLSYDPTSGEGVLQLVAKDAHLATYPHLGGVSQSTASTGKEYQQ